MPRRPKQQMFVPPPQAARAAEVAQTAADKPIESSEAVRQPDRIKTFTAAIRGLNLASMTGA